jgi:hypothetical protein
MMMSHEIKMIWFVLHVGWFRFSADAVVVSGAASSRAV